VILHLAFVGLGASDWSALGQMLVGVASIAGGLWAIRLFRESRRLEVAKWLDGIFRDFYVNESFADIRWLLAYRTFVGEIAPLLDRTTKHPADVLNPDATQILHRLDRLLNYFEHVLYMESEGYVPASAREAFFGYWFELMKSEAYLPLRHYIATYGYEHLDRFLSNPRRQR
jgi:hypothetical protein